MGDQPPGRRLEGSSRQRAGEIGLVEADDAATLGGGPVTEPRQLGLVRRGQDDERVRRPAPLDHDLGVGDGERESGVDRLAGLGARREVSAGDDVQPVGALPVAHGLEDTGVCLR